VLTGGSRIYTWNYDNKPSSVTGVDNVTEQYGYDGDTNRVYRSRNGITTFYLGQWEEDSTGVKKQYYSFGGNTVAMRDSLGNLTYLHSDHLGSVSLATTSNGNIASQQYFDPWGKVKSGGIGQTSLNYTGQRLDGTGLLYYNARYYDPALGKFLTPDNITPGADSQSFNRYTYVKNNPLKYSDPTGHYSKQAPLEEHDEPMSDEEAQAAVAAATATQTSATPRIQVPTTGTRITTSAAANTNIVVTTSASATNTGETTTTAFPGIVPTPTTTGFPAVTTVCLPFCVNTLTPGAFNPNISNNESDEGNAGNEGEKVTEGNEPEPPNDDPSIQVDPNDPGKVLKDKGFVENPNRNGSWGKNDGKPKPDGSQGYREYYRVDKGDPNLPGYGGKDHVHHYGGKDHLDPNTPFNPDAPHSKDA